MSVYSSILLPDLRSIVAYVMAYHRHHSKQYEGPTAYEDRTHNVFDVSAFSAWRLESVK